MHPVDQRQTPGNCLFEDRHPVLRQPPARGRGAQHQHLGAQRLRLGQRGDDGDVAADWRQIAHALAGLRAVDHGNDRVAAIAQDAFGHLGIDLANSAFGEKRDGLDGVKHGGCLRGRAGRQAR
jgi:hypothetical protein